MFLSEASYIGGLARIVIKQKARRGGPLRCDTPA